MMESWIEVFSLAWLVPLILDSMMAVAISVYDYFVGQGGGIIYLLIYGWLGLSIGLYLVKMYFPSKWLELFGLRGGGEMYDGKTGAWDIVYSVGKPMLRAMFAIIILLQVKPQYITNFIVNPFLEFGALYTESITSVVLPDASAPKPSCPKYLGDYLSQNSCEFLIRPIDDISRVNNTAILRGFDFLMLPGIINVITGLLLISVFFASNLFMALLIIQGIFKFGLALILYPFKVLVYVVNPKDKNAWLNPWDAVDGLVSSLRALVIAMIAVAFILLVNVSVAGALLHFDLTGVSGFGAHSITWLSALMTFILMFKIFDLTKAQLGKYVKDSDMMGFYDKVSGGAKAFAGNAIGLGKKVIGIIKK